MSGRDLLSADLASRRSDPQRRWQPERGLGNLYRLASG